MIVDKSAGFPVLRHAPAEDQRAFGIEPLLFQEPEHRMFFGKIELRADIRGFLALAHQPAFRTRAERQAQ